MFCNTFLSSRGYELRSPLTSTLGFNSLILNVNTGEISDKQREQLTIIHESVQDLLDLINVYSKLDKKPRGTGFGLCLCEKVINLMQGSIWAESEFGKAIVFTFNIPVECGEVESE